MEQLHPVVYIVDDDLYTVRHCDQSSWKQGREDVKKLISVSFRDFIFNLKCLPHPSGRLYGILERFFFRRVHCKL